MMLSLHIFFEYFFFFSSMKQKSRKQNFSYWVVHLLPIGVALLLSSPSALNSFLKCVLLKNKFLLIS